MKKEETTVPTDFLDLLPVGVFQTDITLNLVYANKTAYEVFGYSADEIGPRFNARQLFRQTELPKLAIKTAELLAGRKIQPVVYQMQRKNGDTFPGEVQAVPVFRQNTLIGFRGIVRDLSEWQELKTKTEENEFNQKIFEQRLDFLVSNAPLALFAGDTTGQITFVRGQYAELMGLNLSSQTGPVFLQNDPNPPQFQSNIQTALEGKDSTTTIEVAGILFSVRLSPLRNEDNQITGFIGVVIDVTHERECVELDSLREAHTKLRKRISGLAEKNQPTMPRQLKQLLKEA